METNRIEINPNVMLGKPVIRGTRIPVALIIRTTTNLSKKRMEAAREKIRCLLKFVVVIGAKV